MRRTLSLIGKESNLGEKVKRALNFYIWVDLAVLEQDSRLLIGRKLQGFAELMDEFGLHTIANTDRPVLVGPDNQLPIIELGAPVFNGDCLEKLWREY